MSECKGEVRVYEQVCASAFSQSCFLRAKKRAGHTRKNVPRVRWFFQCDSACDTHALAGPI